MLSSAFLRAFLCFPPWHSSSAAAAMLRRRRGAAVVAARTSLSVGALRTRRPCGVLTARSSAVALFRAPGSWPAGWPHAVGDVGDQCAGALLSSLSWRGKAGAVLSCAAHRCIVLLGGTLAGSADAQAKYVACLLTRCSAHAAYTHTKTRHGRRTSSANRGAVFESLSEAQEASLPCL